MRETDRERQISTDMKETELWVDTKVGEFDSVLIHRHYVTPL